MKPSLTTLRNQLEVANTKKIMHTEEPALNTGFNVALVVSAIGSLLLIAHGLLPKIFTEDVIGIIAALASVVLPMITAYFARKKVWAPATVFRLLNEAIIKAKEEVHAEQSMTNKSEVTSEEYDPPMPETFKA